MAQGGTRPGAGRPKGAQNRATAAKAAEIAASGLTPLDYMLAQLRDVDASAEDRFKAAVAAAPYVHPRLSTVDATVEGGLRIEIVDNDG